VEEAIIVKRLIIGISGASGAIYGVRLLQILRDVPDVETHLIMSQAARQTLALETEYSLREVQALADVVHDARDIAASISSGSFKTAGMAIALLGENAFRNCSQLYRWSADPCGGRGPQRASSAGSVRAGNAVPSRHLRLLVQAAEMGAVIMPPVPAFYHRPQTLDDVINQTVNRVIDQFDITLPQDLFTRWQGPSAH
jgi:4-hydroxy-3-polyprenylbenzoate decarboxylase